MCVECGMCVQHLCVCMVYLCVVWCMCECELHVHEEETMELNLKREQLQKCAHYQLYGQLDTGCTAGQ